MNNEGIETKSGNKEELLEPLMHLLRRCLIKKYIVKKGKVGHDYCDSQLSHIFNV